VVYCSKQRGDCECFKSCLWFCYESKKGAEARLWHHASLSHLFVCYFLCHYGYLVEVFLLLHSMRRIGIQFTFQPYTSLSKFKSNKFKSNKLDLSLGTQSISSKLFKLKCKTQTLHTGYTHNPYLYTHVEVLFRSIPSHTHSHTVLCVYRIYSWPLCHNSSFPLHIMMNTGLDLPEYSFQLVDLEEKMALNIRLWTVL